MNSSKKTAIYNLNQHRDPTSTQNPRSLHIYVGGHEEMMLSERGEDIKIYLKKRKGYFLFSESKINLDLFTFVYFYSSFFRFIKLALQHGTPLGILS